MLLNLVLLVALTCIVSGCIVFILNCRPKFAFGLLGREVVCRLRGKIKAVSTKADKEAHIVIRVTWRNCRHIII